MLMALPACTNKIKRFLQLLLEVLYTKYACDSDYHLLIIFLQCFKISFCNFGRVLQPAESAFPPDPALLSDAPATHIHQYHHHCLQSHIPKKGEQPSDIFVQTQVGPHCSHHCSRCYSASRKMSLGQLIETFVHTLTASRV